MPNHGLPQRGLTPRGLTPRDQTKKDAAAADTQTMRALTDTTPNRPVVNMPMMMKKGLRAEDVLRARELRKERLVLILMLAGAGVGSIAPFVALMLLSAGHLVAGSITGAVLFIGTLLASPWITDWLDTFRDKQLEAREDSPYYFGYGFIGGLLGLLLGLFFGNMM